MKAKKKISLIVLGFKKKPNPTIRGYVTSNSVKDQWKRILDYIAKIETAQ